MSHLDGLPMVKDAKEMLRVHSAGGTFFVGSTGKMHGRIDCRRAFGDAPERIIGDPCWRWLRGEDRRSWGSNCANTAATGGVSVCRLAHHRRRVESVVAGANPPCSSA